MFAGDFAARVNFGTYGTLGTKKRCTPLYLSVPHSLTRAFLLSRIMAEHLPRGQHLRGQPVTAAPLLQHGYVHRSRASEYMMDARTLQHRCSIALAHRVPMCCLDARCHREFVRLHINHHVRAGITFIKPLTALLDPNKPQQLCSAGRSTTAAARWALGGTSASLSRAGSSVSLPTSTRYPSPLRMYGADFRSRALCSHTCLSVCGCTAFFGCVLCSVKMLFTSSFAPHVPVAIS